MGRLLAALGCIGIAACGGEPASPTIDAPVGTIDATAIDALADAAIDAAAIDARADAAIDARADAAVIDDAAIDARPDAATDATVDAAPTTTVWIPIAGGAFVMGNNAGPVNERPEHTVTVPAFQMMRSEVTVAAYRACVTAGVCAAPGPVDIFCVAGTVNSSFADRDQHPVNCVRWADAVAYCGFVGARLPSESEWEFAARGPTPSRLYAWGAAAPTCTLAVMAAGGAGCGTGHTAPVCSKPAGNTPDGLCDVGGNVWEWVQDDTYTGDGYAGAPTDGSPRTHQPPSPWRSTRGSAWSEDATFSRATIRIGWGAPHADETLGFRCARAAI